MNAFVKRLLTVLGALFLLVYVVYQGYQVLYSPIRTETVYSQSMYETVDTRGFTVRNETPITGSASGGLTIALELFGETFISWGYTPEIIHRVASIACGGLDTLPWNGTVVMLFALSGVSYKKGYKHVAMETVILPLLSLIPVFIYYSIVH